MHDRFIPVFIILVVVHVVHMVCLVEYQKMHMRMAAFFKLYIQLHSALMWYNLITQ